MIIKLERATKKQIEYLEQLVIDLQFDLPRRNAHIEFILGRKITFLDQLTKLEASAVIDKFKLWKKLKLIIERRVENRV